MNLVWMLYSKTTGDIKQSSARPIKKKAPKGLVWGAFLVQEHVLKNLSQYKIVRRGGSLVTELKSVNSLLVS